MSSERSDRLAVLSFILVVPAIGSLVAGVFVAGLVPLYVSMGLSALAGVTLLLSVRAARRAGPSWPVTAGARLDRRAARERGVEGSTEGDGQQRPPAAPSNTLYLLETPEDDLPDADEMGADGDFAPEDRAGEDLADSDADLPNADEDPADADNRRWQDSEFEPEGTELSATDEPEAEPEPQPEPEPDEVEDDEHDADDEDERDDGGDDEVGGEQVMLDQPSERHDVPGDGEWSPLPVGDARPVLRLANGLRAAPQSASTAKEEATAEDEPAEFPIEDYSELTVRQVVSVLSALDAQELDVVREHERRHANRTTILKRIDEVLARRESPRR